DLLNSLLGGSTLSGIVNAVARFATIAPGAAQKLIGYLTPIVLGAISSQLAGKSATTQALAGLLATEKSNIASAIPAGLSLRDVPGLAAAGSAAVRSAAQGVESAGSSLARWLLPLAAVAALGLLLWRFMPSASTPAPEVRTGAGVRAQSPDSNREPIAEV